MTSLPSLIPFQRRIYLTVLIAAGALIPLVAQSPQDPEVKAPLSDDAAAGRVIDREGTAARRPVLAERWGPANEATRIEVGDWLKTGTRGANALAAALSGGGQILLGPAALVEVVDGQSLKLNYGEIEVIAGDGSAVAVTGAGGLSVEVTERAVLRAEDGKLRILDQDPRWLTGYRNNASTEAMGSLLANIDGRNVPLTMGYQKVTVDIRDQIARTVIEESFVNHTSTILEGVFYFPLPADASISSFGMWIGNEVVQGEIVEKQRAREIYETILREKRDPGLLEWAGGNLFKARVFPIGGEKRIRIAYTQVLPRKGSGFAYRYGLRSEMTRLNPLEKLQITVNVSSSGSITDVVSTLPCRVRQAEHSAQVEFAAEEYTPERDFELIVGLAPQPETVTFVPHRRGDDGYFMLMFQAPDGPVEGHGRSIHPPVELLIMADTSGSMWGAPREAQIRFLDALLSTLGEGDRFNLVTCDIESNWAFENSQLASAENRERALAFLEARPALGWTDLDGALASVRERAGRDTHVIYVGDGVNTSGDADPAALANRIVDEYELRGTFHAVVPGSSSEMLVLRALAAVGGGSVRSLSDAADPGREAFELMQEISNPAVKDLAIRFEGIDAAATYPDPLPNLSAGMQQIVIGRFDPLAGATKGRVVVTGTFDGRPVSAEAAIDLDTGETGNSFIPRLWARRHLDALLAEGSSPGLEERIIALSEDFQIITPYTSFLVLETEEDRERFSVQKAFRMRDGEEFFASGRDKVLEDLRRQQMLKAKQWRNRLRAELIAGLSGMGRSLTELLRMHGIERQVVLGAGVGGMKSQYGGRARNRAAGDAMAPMESAAPSLRMSEMPKGESLHELGYVDEEEVMLEQDLNAFDDGLADRAFDADGLDFYAADHLAAKRVQRMNAPASAAVPGRASRADQLAMSMERREAGRIYGGEFRDDYRGYDPYESLFPGFSGSRPDAADYEWSAEILAELRALNRRHVIAELDGMLQVVIETTSRDQRERQHVARGATWMGHEQWAVAGMHLEGHEFVSEWNDGQQRRVMLESTRLGRKRASQSEDNGAWAAPFSWHFGDSLRSYRSYSASVTVNGSGLREYRFVHEDHPEQHMILLVDPARAAVIEQRWVNEDGVRSRTQFLGFEEHAGAWWPTRIRVTGDEGELRSSTELSYTPFSASESARMLELMNAETDSEWLFEVTETELVEAKQAVKDESASPEDHWLLLRHHALQQRWEEAAPHHAALQSRFGATTGWAAFELVWLSQKRRLEEMRQSLLASAIVLRDERREADIAFANYLNGYAQSLQSGTEWMEVLRILEPVYERHTSLVDYRLHLDRQILQALNRQRRPQPVFDWHMHLARTYPFDASLQVEAARLLAQRGKTDEAIAFLMSAESEGSPWQEHEVRQFRGAILSTYWNAYRLEDVVSRVEEWQRTEPERAQGSWLNQYLSALVYLDREDAAWVKIEEWLATRPPELSDADNARLWAAVQHAIGRGHALYHQRFETDRADLLIRTAEALLEHQETWSLAGQILTDYRFRRTDECMAALDRLFISLQEEVGSLSIEALQTQFAWLSSAGFRGGERQAEWNDLLLSVHARWQAAEQTDKRNALLSLILSYGETDLVLRVRREQYAEADGEHERIVAAQTLFQLLLSQEWTAEIQTELLALLRVQWSGRSSQSESDEQFLHRGVLALYDLASWMPRTRTDALVAALPEVNSLPRRQLAAERDRLQRQAREETLSALSGLLKGADGSQWEAWIEIERAYLLARLRMGLAGVRQHVLARLEQLTRHHADSEGDDIPIADRVLAERAALTYLHLLSRYAPELRAEHQAALRQFLAAELEGGSELIDWKQSYYELLMVLDEGDALAEALRNWFGDGSTALQMQWGVALAYVMAERDQLQDAVAVLRQVEEADELTSEQYESLSDWYLALNDREAARAARISAYEVSGANAIANALQREVQQYQRHGDGIPPELDASIPTRLIALFRKEAHPANRVWLLQQFYAPTKDFRLLECIPEAVIGHSAQGIYSFLQGITSVTGMIDEEATADRLIAHLHKMRESAVTAVDARALHLLEFLVERRAVDQGHGVERHVKLALAALRAAEQGEWADGEPRLYAEFLERQGVLHNERLASEQLRQIRALAALAGDRFDRTQARFRYANLLWQYQRQDEAVRTLAASLEQFRAEEETAQLPNELHQQLRTLMSWNQAMGSYRGAERILRAELALDYPVQFAHQFEQWLYELYRDAIFNQGETSLGRGYGIYPAFYSQALARVLERTNENHARQLIRTMCAVWQRFDDRRDAPDKHTVRQDSLKFAFQELPKVLRLYQYRNGQTMVREVADCLNDVAGGHRAVEFLVVRAENEPAWLRLRNEDFWQRHGYALARYREEGRRINSDLEDRLLAIVLRELYADLRTHVSRNRAMYSDQNNYFWSAKRADFRAAALDVLTEELSEKTVMWVATYLYTHLDAHSEAIDALYTLHRRAELGLDGQAQLVNYLQEQRRWRESIPLLVTLIDERPEAAHHRAQLMYAYHETEDREALASALETAELWLRANEPANENYIATLASASMHTLLFRDATRLFDEAIALHVKTHANRGVGNGVLSNYYQEQARAWSGLGETDRAVDSAAGAIVSWGGHVSNRQQALHRLEQILADSEDLDAYVRRLNDTVASTGLENPIVRKAVGKVYYQARRFKPAIQQLELALEGQPNDLETRQLLLQAYDANNDYSGAAAAALAWALTSGYEPQRYRDLGDRYRRLEQSVDAERAYTMLVETMPNESEGHAMLASVRQQQRDWDAAANHWQHVIRIRSDEPEGYLRYAESCIQREQSEEARATLLDVLSREWDVRFGDAHREARQMLERVQSSS